MRTRVTGVEPAGARRAYLAAFGATLALAMAVGTYPGFVFGALAPYLVDEYELSRTQLGLLTTVFFVVGAGLSLLAGPLVDRIGGRRVMLGSLAILAAALLGMVLAPSYPAFLAMAALAGLSLSTGNPATNKLIAIHVPAGRRGVLMGVKQAGVQAAAFVAGAVLPPLAGVWGWRTALAATMALPLGAVLATLRVVPAHEPVDGRTTGTAVRVAPAVRWLALYAFLMGSGVAAVTAYLPLFAVERLSFSPQRAGAVVATMGLTALISRIVWGWASERFSTYLGPLLVMAAGSAAAIFLLLVAQQGLVALVWAAGVLLGATAVTWNSVGMLTVVVEAGAAAAGTASGYVVAAFYGGFVASPIVFGGLVDRTGSYGLGWSVVAGVFGLAALVVILRRRSSRVASPETKDQARA